MPAYYALVVSHIHIYTQSFMPCMLICTYYKYTQYNTSLHTLYIHAYLYTHTLYTLYNTADRRLVQLPSSNTAIYYLLLFLYYIY